MDYIEGRVATTQEARLHLCVCQEGVGFGMLKAKVAGGAPHPNSSIAMATGESWSQKRDKHLERQTSPGTTVLDCRGRGDCFFQE
uniref:Uncharacterized protein n=2 Tax=Canis lupus familiaris TaxID=9615 RepID=A0A8C0RVC8_CANLF